MKSATFLVSTILHSLVCRAVCDGEIVLVFPLLLQNCAIN